MTELQLLNFNQPNLGAGIKALDDAELDNLDFGVIGFDVENVVRRYNAFESKSSGLSPSRVLGLSLFDVVAPCMNNFMVAQRFEDAAINGVPLDATIDYVLTLRMRPVKVQMRLLASPDSAMRYVLIYWPASNVR